MVINTLIIFVDKVFEPILVISFALSMFTMGVKVSSVVRLWKLLKKQRKEKKDG